MAQLYRPTLRLNNLLRNFGRRAVFGAEPASDCFLAKAATNGAQFSFLSHPDSPEQGLFLFSQIEAAYCPRQAETQGFPFGCFLVS